MTTYRLDHIVHVVDLVAGQRLDVSQREWLVVDILVGKLVVMVGAGGGLKVNLGQHLVLGVQAGRYWVIQD